MSVDNVSNELCRLCDGQLIPKFTLRVLDKYNVKYLHCSRCESLQTEHPYWLHETYNGTLPNLDDGAARRSLRSASLLLMTSSVLGLARSSRVLDFGGGDGLVCRYLRDAGFNAFIYDKYASNFYANGFSGGPSEAYDIVCAIEVVEHLPTPNVELAQIFSSKPALVIISTDRYRGQGKEWRYIGPDQGGHVFFYSDKALNLIACQYHYTLVSRDSSAVFVQKKMMWFRRTLLWMLLHPVGLLAGRIWLQLIRPHRP